ncbi:OLC1v1021926C1 [Oldenlandia corymbosa var. corymbosa]|uniref:OLC1v1021926C1 n=1 Tax=Oldenlandia corymbosa var. corymbosa TaxID=529605 RepID=A0AAV1C9I2_OLDCO|nr:OLC1v1021926C1 [Oldenlandia corymbosa var. corymbosa]
MSRERERIEEIGKKIKRESDAQFNNIHNQLIINRSGNALVSSSSSSSLSLLGGSLNTITPCAACKLLRRRCAQECPFSPYFSPHEPQKFASVHKVFGASNVSKMLMEVPESQRSDAANSLVYEANVRLRDPVYGCMGAISALQQQVQSLQAELHAVRSEILRYKYRENSNNNNINIHHVVDPSDHGLALLSSGVVSIASLPPPPILPPSGRLLLDLPHPHASSSSSSASMYSSPPPPPQPPASSSAPPPDHHHDFSSISNDHDIPFFG